MAHAEKKLMAAEDAQARKARKQFSNQLSTLAGGLALLWIAAFWLLNLPFGLGLAGAGILLLAEQGIRRRHGLRIDIVWAVGAVIAIIAGLAMLAGIAVAFGPLILAVIAITMIASVLLDRDSDG